MEMLVLLQTPARWLRFHMFGAAGLWQSRNIDGTDSIYKHQRQKQKVALFVHSPACAA